VIMSLDAASPFTPIDIGHADASLRSAVDRH
jgi:hypothetical protein